MTDREKAIKGLQKIAEFFKARGDMAVGDGKMLLLSWMRAAEDAIALLEAQEPVRVLSWEEIEFVYGNPYILEISVPDAGSWMEYGLYSHQGIRGNVDFINTTGRKRLEADYYGKTWRCWSSRPTDAQREVTPWIKS